MAVLVYAVVSVLLCAAALRTRSRLLFFVIPFVSIVFLFGFLWFSQSSYRTIQVRKIGYEFDKAGEDYRNPARVIRIGGDRDKDDLYLQELDPGAVQITPSLHNTSFDVQAPRGGVLIERNGTLLNSVELTDGDTLEANRQSLQFHARGARNRSLTLGNRVWEWPHKNSPATKVRRPDLSGSLEEQFYPLTQVAAVLGIPAVVPGALGLRGLRFERSSRPISMNSVFLAGYDSQMTVNRKPLPSRWTCEDGDRLRFFVLQESQGSLRARRVASFVVRNRDLLMFLHTSAETLGMRDELLQGSGSAPLLLTTSRLPYSAFPTISYQDESSRFAGIVAFVQPFHDFSQEDFVGKIERQIRESLSMDVPRFEVVTDQGTFRPLAGERIALGNHDRILFTLDETHFPWSTFNILLVFILIRVLFYPPLFQPFENQAAALLLSLVDFFLATRLLFGFRAASLYPFSQETVPLALLAFLLVPYLLFVAALLLRIEWRRTHVYHFAAYTILTAIAGAYLLPDYTVLVIAVGIVSTIAAVLLRHPRSPLNLIAERRDLMKTPAELLLGLLVLAAVLLRMSGIGEALKIGGMRLPLALLYQPALLWLAARALQDFRRRLLFRDDLTFRSAMIAGGRVLLVMAVFFLVSFLTSDFGFFLIYCVPVVFLLFGISILYIAEYEMRLKAAGLLLAIPVLGIILLFSSYSTINRLLPQRYFDTRVVQRILLAVDPESLEETGLVAAERQLGHQRMFLAYARSGWDGAGYGKRPISPALAATALNDNVPSVFLMNDFGIAGVAGVSLVLLMMGFLWIRALRTQPDAGAMPLSDGAMLSLVSVATWLYAGFYMIFANCGILLFTGKNVFLWGLNSTSDIFQSAALLAFIVIPLRQKLDVPAVERAVLPAQVNPVVAGELA